MASFLMHKILYNLTIKLIYKVAYTGLSCMKRFASFGF
jgi:hypothetical protein